MGRIVCSFFPPDPLVCSVWSLESCAKTLFRGRGKVLHAPPKDFLLVRHLFCLYPRRSSFFHRGVPNVVAEPSRHSIRPPSVCSFDDLSLFPSVFESSGGGVDKFFFALSPRAAFCYFFFEFRRAIYLFGRFAHFVLVNVLVRPVRSVKLPARFVAPSVFFFFLRPPFFLFPRFFPFYRPRALFSFEVRHHFFCF